MESLDQRGRSLCTLFGTKCRTPQKARPKPLDLTSVAAALFRFEDWSKTEIYVRVGRDTSIAESVPRGGVGRLKRDIAPLSATQLVALLREAGADDGWGVASG